MTKTETQTVRVQLFAVARQLAGAESIEVELPVGATVAELRTRLCENVPAVRQVIEHVRFAVNADYASDATIIPAGADVACIPPVSGG